MSTDRKRPNVRIESVSDNGQECGQQEVDRLTPLNCMNAGTDKRTGDSICTLANCICMAWNQSCRREKAQ